MQYKATHCPLVGMHGSFVLTPARIEREITWDVGGHGSITEDAYFALVAMDRGVRFDWVEGFVREQSPFTLLDLLKQRRRWFCGLSHIARDPAFRFRTTLTLKIQVFFSVLAALVLPLPLVYLQQRFMFGNNVLPYSTFLLSAACSGSLFGHIYCRRLSQRAALRYARSIRKCGSCCHCTIGWFFFIRRAGGMPGIALRPVLPRDDILRGGEGRQVAIATRPFFKFTRQMRTLPKPIRAVAELPRVQGARASCVLANSATAANYCRTPASPCADSAHGPAGGRAAAFYDGSRPTAGQHTLQIVKELDPRRAGFQPASALSNHSRSSTDSHRFSQIDEL